MYGVVLSLWPGDVREPLSRQAGPLQGVGHDKVVQEWSVLLPYLVLLVDYSLLHCLVISCPGENSEYVFTSGNRSQVKYLNCLIKAMNIILRMNIYQIDYWGQAAQISPKL